MRLAVALAFLITTACVRRQGRNPDCIWPSENPIREATRWHLSADAEFAEDLAIRYADLHHGLRTQGWVSPQVYESERNRCGRTLFQEIARMHQVESKRIAQSLGANRPLIDFLENLPFGILYVLAALAATRWIWKRYPPVEFGWTAGIAMIIFLGLVFAVGGSMIGEQWSWTAENLRIGNGHMSYRVQRLPWSRYRIPLTISAAALYTAASLITAKKATR